jgi:hypothetical protein
MSKLHILPPGTVTKLLTLRWFWIAFAIGYYGIYIYLVTAGTVMLRFFEQSSSNIAPGTSFPIWFSALALCWPIAACFPLFVRSAPIHKRLHWCTAITFACCLFFVAGNKYAQGLFVLTAPSLPILIGIESVFGPGLRTEYPLLFFFSSALLFPVGPLLAMILAAARLRVRTLKICLGIFMAMLLAPFGMLLLIR